MPTRIAGRSYPGDPSPGNRRDVIGSAAADQQREPTEQAAGTISDGTGFPLPNFTTTIPVPIVGTANPARTFLALLPIMFGHVKVNQAGGARRLFPNRAPGAFNQSPTSQARDSRRIDRPEAGPWDRGGAVGGR